MGSTFVSFRSKYFWFFSFTVLLVFSSVANATTYEMTYYADGDDHFYSPPIELESGGTHSFFVNGVPWGSYNYVAYKDTGGGYSQIWSDSTSTGWDPIFSTYVSPGYKVKLVIYDGSWNVKSVYYWYIYQSNITDADITSVTVSPDPVVAGSSIIVNYTVENTGNYSRSFSIGCEIRYGSSVIEPDVGCQSTPTISPMSSYSSSFTYTIPSGWSGGTYTARCIAWSGGDCGIDWEDSKDDEFVIESIPVLSVLPAEIIVRIGEYFPLGNPQEAQHLVDLCLANGIPAISLMMKHDETGELFYPSSVPYTQTYDDYTGDYLTDFIELAHKNNLLVYAWMPMFNDPILYLTRPEYRMYVNRNNGTGPIETENNWVSPIISTVRQHRADILQEALSEFLFDGVRIDHSRYTDDWSDWSSPALVQFQVDTGIDPMSLVCCGNPNWITWINWRADQISTFNLNMRDLTLSAIPNASVGAYLFPDTAKEGGYENSWTWSGQRYEDYGIAGMNLAIHPMPMIYWQDWSGGNVYDYINDSLFYSKLLSNPTEVIPVFSVTDITSWGMLTETEIRDYMELSGQLCQANGVTRISYFYYGSWTLNHFERIRASYVGPVTAVTPGFLDFGDVLVGESSTKTFTVKNVGKGTLELSISTSSPFNIVGSSDLTLLENESVIVTVEFIPPDYFLYEGVISFSGQDFFICRNVKGIGVENIVAPEIAPISDHTTMEGLEYVGPIPYLVHGTLPIVWDLINGPDGMNIDNTTGIVSWSDPVTVGSPYDIIIRATNSAGYCDESWQLIVEPNLCSRADLTNDNIVDMADLDIFMVSWLSTEETLQANLNGDEIVNFEDFAILADCWCPKSLVLYELTTNVIGGHGTIFPTEGIYQKDKIVTLVATPFPGYHVKAWNGTDDDSSTSTTNSVTMDSNKIVSVEFAEEVLLHNFSLQVDPGWTVEGEWNFGSPTGGGAVHNGNPDPISGYTGNNVYGVNLNGDYDHMSIGGPYSLIAGPFDCNDYSHITFQFARWLNSDCPPYVRSRIEASNNGTDWNTIWEQADGQTITDSDWQIMEYDISSVADDQPTVYVRWSYEVNDEAYPYSGWNIDDIQLWGIH